MPFAIDEAAARKQMTIDMSKPQEQAPAVLPENWVGTVSRGLPVKLIPFFHFPMVIYLHPIRPTITVLHRNEAHEIVHREEIPTEHLTKVICCDAHKNGGPKDCPDCNKLLEVALADGWLREAYIPAAPEKTDADLYGPGNLKK